jgi:hypothetical protein
MLAFSGTKRYQPDIMPGQESTMDIPQALEAATKFAV